MERIKAILIDDEERARSSLAALLADFCPEVELVAQCANVPDGVLQINKLKPALVFLDIEMPQYTGFELLGFFREVDFEIVFITAYSDYALKAFEVSAVDYILKPVEIEQLQIAVHKVIKKQQQSNMQQRLQVLRDSFRGEELRRIAVPMSDGLLFIELSEIMMLEADGSYTNLFLTNGSKILVCKKMKFFEEVLCQRASFFRPHRSFVINLNYVKKYIRGESNILMDNQMVLLVSRERKQEFEQKLKTLNMAV